MAELTLALPWPPSVNSYWRSPNKGPLAGRTLISVKGREYRKAVELRVTDCLLDEASEYTPSWRSKNAPVLSRLCVALYAYPPDKRRRDIDNLPKAVLDALTHAGVWADDEQIDSLSIQRMGRVPGGQIVAVVSEVAQ